MRLNALRREGTRAKAQFSRRISPRLKARSPGLKSGASN